MPCDHPEIMHRHEGLGFVLGIRSLSAVEVEPVNVMSRETVFWLYVDSIKRGYDYVLLNSRPSLGYAGYPHSFCIGLCACLSPGGLSDYLAVEDLIKMHYLRWPSGIQKIGRSRVAYGQV